MAEKDRLRIAYVGGGSRFVVTLLHGLAEYAGDFATLDYGIDLRLLDPDVDRAGEMQRYAEITFGERDLDILASVTADRDEALRDADWVIFSAGVWKPIMEARKVLAEDLGLPAYGEMSTGVMAEMAGLWAFVDGLAEDMKRLCPKAVFSSLVNPTDVIAGAVQKKYDIRSNGLCVEVPGLRGWLSYYLKIPETQINLEPIGVNHCGWIARGEVAGEDLHKVFAEKIPPQVWQPDWYGHCTAFVELFQRTGHLRSSPYHLWPVQTVWTDRHDKQSDIWHKTCLPEGFEDKKAYRKAVLAEALKEGKMIPDPNGLDVHPEATPYTYPNTRWTLGAIALGLAGGAADPVPMQVENDMTNPHGGPNDAWLEVPVHVKEGHISPQAVPELDRWVYGEVDMIALQRAHLTNWLAGTDKDGLVKGMTMLPQVGPFDKLQEFMDKLPQFINAQRDAQG